MRLHPPEACRELANVEEDPVLDSVRLVDAGFVYSASPTGSADVPMTPKMRPGT